MEKAFHKTLFIILVIIGFVMPGYLSIEFIYMYLFNSTGMTDLRQVELIMNVLLAELIIIYIAWVYWVVINRQRLNTRRWWIYPLLTLVTPFAFVFSLMLLFNPTVARRDNL